MRIRFAAVAALTLLLCPADEAAADVKIFRMDTRDAAVLGEVDGTSVGPLGELGLAPELERVVGLEEPFVFAAVPSGDGWLLGTGNDGKVVQAWIDGGAKVLGSTPEPEVFSVLRRRDGSVVAGSSPEGKVYRIADGVAEVIFDPEDTYIWDLAEDAQGRLLVATGLRGRVYRVDDDGEAETLWQSPDGHVRTLAVLDDGGLLLGTAGQGLIVHRSAAGETRTLYDATQPEVLDFAVAGDRIYAAVLASEASLVDLSATAQAAGEEGAAVVVKGAEATIGSRASTFAGARSVVLGLHLDGRVDPVVALEDETIHALAWYDDALWLGTGQEGHLYRYRDEILVREKALEERQIVALPVSSSGLAVVTTNTASIHRVVSGEDREGTYVSAVYDAKERSRFGSLRWQGERPRGARVELSARSGMTAVPDATWSDWTPVTEDAAPGREHSLEAVPRGRWVQWKGTLVRGEGGGPTLTVAELSYRQENLRPDITSLEVLDPGEILVPSSFNASSTTFEPWSPNREGIFTSLQAETPRDEGRLKTLWKKGYRTLKWTAEDRNGDGLRYRLELARGGTLADDANWLTIVSDLDQDYHVFDATVLPDGVYRFRLIASDGSDRVAAEALESTRVSGPVVIDHAPPGLVSKTRGSGGLEVVLEDAGNPIRDVAVSVDAGPWAPVTAVDGLLDGRTERLRVDVPGDARLVLLRVTDAAFNVVTLDLLAD
ncbi:MAG: hypothetical protein AAGD06_12820 [Acidobacteriota bacterium]